MKDLMTRITTAIVTDRILRVYLFNYLALASFVCLAIPLVGWPDSWSDTFWNFFRGTFRFNAGYIIGFTISFTIKHRTNPAD